MNGQVNSTFEMTLELKGSFYLKKQFKVYLKSCVIGEYYDNISMSCIECPLGTYSFQVPPMDNENNPGVNFCQVCPQNAQCKGFIVAPLRDFWINLTNETTEIVQCPLAGTCLLQSNIENFTKPIKCAQGYWGPLCSLCEEGYAKEGYASTCGTCKATAKSAFLAIFKLIFIFSFVGYQVYFVLKKKFYNGEKRNGVVLKIVRDHFNQIFLIFSFCNVFKLEDDYMGLYQTINDIITGSVLNFDCLHAGSTDIFYFKLITIFFSPIIMVMIIGCLLMLFFGLKFRKNINKKIILNIFKIFCISFLIICDILYIQLTTAFSKLFVCEKLDSTIDKTYLKFSTNLECFTKEHNNKIYGIGIPYILFWILGLPVSYLIMLWKYNKDFVYEVEYPKSSKRKVMFMDSARKSRNSASTYLETDNNQQNLGILESNIDFQMMLSALFYDYKKRNYYWIVVILLWKLILTILIVFVDINYLFTVLFCFYIGLMWLYLLNRPYINRSCTYLMNVSLSCNLSSIILGEYVNRVNTYNSSIAKINLIIHIFFFIFALVLFLDEYNVFVFAKNHIIEFLRKYQNNNKFIMTILRKIENFNKKFQPINYRA